VILALLQYSKKPCPLGSSCRNSLLNGTGNYFGGTGNFLGLTGNSIPRAGKTFGDSPAYRSGPKSSRTKRAASKSGVGSSTARQFSRRGAALSTFWEVSSLSAIGHSNQRLTHYRISRCAVRSAGPKARRRARDATGSNRFLRSAAAMDRGPSPRCRHCRVFFVMNFASQARAPLDLRPPLVEPAMCPSNGLQ
jgi:hypothetical protein